MPSRILPSRISVARGCTVYRDSCVSLDELVIGAHGVEAETGDLPHVSGLAKVVFRDEVVGQIARGVPAAPVLTGRVPLRTELVEIRLGVAALAVGRKRLRTLGQVSHWAMGTSATTWDSRPSRAPLRVRRGS